MTTCFPYRKISKIMNKTIENRKKRLGIFENAHAAMGCFLYMSLVVLGLIVSICVILLIARWLFPQKVTFFNYYLSSRTFTELKGTHRYKAAVDFYEQKKDVFTSEGDKYINMTEVFDCYKRIGEYEKAEAILRDMDSLKYLTNKEIKELNEKPWYADFLRFHIAKEYFNLYEEMGDIEGQKRYYAIMKEHLTPDVIMNIKKLQKKYKDYDTLFLNNPMQFYDLKMIHLSSPKLAIIKAQEYLVEINNSGCPEPTLFLRYANILCEWLIDYCGVLPSYAIVCEIIEFAINTDSYNNNKSEYGKLSDICYRVHDIKNSKWFYSKYTTYLEQNTSKDDPLYIKNQIRGFRYLEDEQNWSELETQVIECCVGLRVLLAKNIYTMSEAQREHFVNLLKEPFDYAADLLYDHPTDKLASLCFENSIFMKGLLLRSNREMANKIRSSSDSTLVEMFEQLQEYRKEFSYRESIGGLGGNIKKRELRKNIDSLDKKLAISCPEYFYDRMTREANIRSISKSLKPNAAIVDFIQSANGNLIAIVCTNDGKVKSMSLGTNSEVLEIFNNYRDYWSTYKDTILTHKIWTPIEQYLVGINNIYYTTNGIFNSIPLQALYLGAREHLIDRYDFNLLSNAGNLITMQNDTSRRNKKLAIWGGIEYGDKDKPTSTTDTTYRSIMRGDQLKKLIFSGAEVDAIKRIAVSKSIEVSSYKDTLATELSFRKRSGKKDNIIHVSTHGFFDEDDTHRKDYNPMYNSGLFFAGADNTWNTTDTIFVASSMDDDGILRASEIQYLDFSNCSLAVLSACVTGLGYSDNIEGVYGLQRAFKLAGVDKILMSLWYVPDLSTSELMQKFYHYYLNDGFTYEEALRAAQSAVREEHPDPKCWGAFVLLN